jgi:two-component system, NtrC family, response regulator AtoC
VRLDSCPAEPRQWEVGFPPRFGRWEANFPNVPHYETLAFRSTTPVQCCVTPTALILDDEPQMCVSLAKVLKSQGIDAHASHIPEEGLMKAMRQHYDVIITDLRMPRVSGIDVLDRIRTIAPDTPTIMISGYATVEDIVRAMKLGAANFYEKPLDAEKLTEEVKQIIAMGRPATAAGSGPPRIVSRNVGFVEILNGLATIAPTDAPVILTGESGTGKELIAHAIHHRSPRAEKPLVTINCAAIPDTLLESELFGHEKGAFTDAHSSRAGKFEAAGAGTIFLDEITEMRLETQAKLLRVIQERSYEKLGSNETRSMDARIIAATNRDLEEMVRQGSFRSDLYYRLSVICLRLPPLRKRKEDISLLADLFLEEFADKYRKPARRLDERVSRFFDSHDWPGNVRELRNCIERAVIYCSGETIEVDHLPEQYRMLSPAENRLESIYASITREIILEALQKTNGNRGQAAELLNMSRRTLYSKMKKLGLG